MEMLAVISIIMIMSVIVFANYKTGNQRFAIQLEAYHLAQDLRKTQEYAMSARDVPGYDPSGFCIYLSQGNNYYKIYADTTVPPNYICDPASDLLMETVTFDKKVYIKTITSNTLSVEFSPPDPTTTLTQGGVSVAQANIILGMQDSTLTQTVIVSRGGLIYVQ